jgi:hypothetical protein
MKGVFPLLELHMALGALGFFFDLKAEVIQIVEEFQLRAA